MLKFLSLARKSIASLEPVELVLISWRWRTLDTIFHKKKITLNVAAASAWNLFAEIKALFRIINTCCYLEDGIWTLSSSPPISYFSLICNTFKQNWITKRSLSPAVFYLEFLHIVSFTQNAFQTLLWIHPSGSSQLNTEREVLGTVNTIGTRFPGFISKSCCALCWIHVAASTALLNLSLLSASVTTCSSLQSGVVVVLYVVNVHLWPQLVCTGQLPQPCPVSSDSFCSWVKQGCNLKEMPTPPAGHQHHLDWSWNTNSLLMFVSFISNLSLFLITDPADFRSSTRNRGDSPTETAYPAPMIQRAESLWSIPCSLSFTAVLLLGWSPDCHSQLRLWQCNSPSHCHTVSWLMILVFVNTPMMKVNILMYFNTTFIKQSFGWLNCFS